MVGDADAADKAAGFEIMTSTVVETLALEVGEVIEVESEAGAKRYSGERFCTHTVVTGWLIVPRIDLLCPL